jgi:hypothetical protein
MGGPPRGGTRAGGEQLDRRDQLLERRALLHEHVRAGVGGAVGGAHRVHPREHNEPNAGVRRADRRGDLEAVERCHREIGDDDVGTEVAHHAQRLDPVARVADDLDPLTRA